MAKGDLSMLRKSSCIQKIDILDRIVLAGVLLKLFIGDFLGLGKGLNLLLLGLMFLILMSERRNIPRYFLVGFPALFIPLLYGIFSNQDLGNAVGNFIRIVQVLIYVLYASSVMARYHSILSDIILESASLFNIVLILNSIVMIVQYAFPGILVASHSGSEVMQVDLISGLFAYGSTHVVALFTVFVVVLNIFARMSGVRSWYTSIVYQVVLATYSVLFAEFNDNKALWFFLPLVLIAIGSVYLWLNRRSLGMKFLACVVFVVIFALLAYWVFPCVRAFVDDNVIKSIQVAIRAFSPTAYANGSDERFKIIAYAFCLPEFWMLGDGIGAAGLYEASYRDFPHFGQTDFGSIGILCGFWYYLIIVLFFSRAVMPECGKNKFIQPLVTLLVICISLYTQPFTQVRIAVPAIMLCAVFVQSLNLLFEQVEVSTR